MCFRNAISVYLETRPSGKTASADDASVDWQRLLQSLSIDSARRRNTRDEATKETLVHVLTSTFDIVTTKASSYKRPTECPEPSLAIV